MNALILRAVTKSFSTVRAVDALSVRVPGGSIYGFLGPNGAGKTTTLRMIMNIIGPDSGRIEILGRTPNALVLERIGYMPEERGLYRKMTVRAVLTYLAALKGMKRRTVAKEIARWLDVLGLKEWAERKVEELSKGMQQKLQFIATVISDPDLLILDEPFSGLDPVNLDLLEGIMLEMRGAGKTVLFSTHVMERAEKLCDFILLINKGRTVFDGTLDQIRAGYKSNSVVVELDGDTDFIRDLPMVETVGLDGKRLEVALKENADSQELLRALVGRVRVRSFEEKVPSLHEIFVRLVGESHE